MTKATEARRHKVGLLKGTREARNFGAEFELRDNADDDTVRVIGCASVTNHIYEVGSRRERILPRAFRRTLSQNPQVFLLAQHEGYPLASTRGGSLALEEHQRGLKVTAVMDVADPDVDRVVRKVRRGDMTVRHSRSE